MRNALSIARKELTIYFTTPWAWLVFTAMTFITSLWFVGLLEQFREAQHAARERGWANMPQEFRNLTDGVIIPLWGTVLIVTLFVAPFLTMRLFSEERRQKTFELLMTLPARPIEIVLGKFLGGLIMVSATVGLTILYPVIVSLFGASESGSALEWSTVCLGYAAMLMWGATCVAIGLLMSSLTESQAIAAVLTFAVLLVWLGLGMVVARTEEPLRSVLGYVSFDTQLSNLMKGVLDLKPVAFFLSIIGFSLVLTHRSVESQRWT